MQQWQVTKRGGALAGFWLALPALPVWLLLRSFYPLPSALLCLAWAVYMPIMYAMRATAYSLQIKDGVLTVHRGMAFYNERRLPTAFISGVHFVRTPLQRATGTCCMVITAAGCTLLVVGLSYTDACAVRDRVLYTKKARRRS